ncbi:hypothetical protein BT93_K0054 [Corymbia citriodora subsp. variegata]|nr:hypothetical protein BT93_K0054 [Corymbia citriodora subsp. variegata]
MESSGYHLMFFMRFNQQILIMRTGQIMPLIMRSHPVRAVVGPRICAADSFPNFAINFKESGLRDLRGWAYYPGLWVNRGLMNNSTGKYRGTGVFIPKPTEPWKESDGRIMKGAHVSFSQQVFRSFPLPAGERNRPSYQGNGMTKKENLQKQVPESPLISTQIMHLPDDWTYEIY